MSVEGPERFIGGCAFGSVRIAVGDEWPGRPGVAAWIGFADGLPFDRRSTMSNA
jgi:hypothetical protein